MSDNNNISAFTAADIEKYHKGLLSSKEMHAMEKAALDDPFLADALEGYSVEGVDVPADIAELKKRLLERTEEAKVIPLYGSSKSSFPWMRAAVLIIFLAGAGLLSYQFLFKSKNTDIAQAKQNGTDTATTNETSRANVADTSLSNKSNNAAIDEIASPSQNKNPETAQELATHKLSEKAASETAKEKNELTGIKDDKNVPVASTVTVKKEEFSKSNELVTRPAAGNTDAYRKDVTTNDEKAGEALRRQKAATEAEGMTDKQQRVVTANAKGIINTDRNNLSAGYTNMNYFRGRVTDANNNPLPFTNVTNTADNVGTYTDAKGNFVLVSTDTTLDLQLRSLGYKNNLVRLSNDIPINQLIMWEDKGLDAVVLDTVKRNFAARSREGNMTLEEPEPVDGWLPYGSYVANNLNVPENFERKNSSDDNIVELSFEVNKFGDPVNIKVEKSLCDKCDKEAIRLIKEGPKWKRKAKKNKRTTVRVPFVRPSD